MEIGKLFIIIIICIIVPSYVWRVMFSECCCNEDKKVNNCSTYFHFKIRGTHKRLSTLI